ncbi:hypothetical protein E5K00_13175 [Hymenobacter aquaticus]|uniref:Uncharacterized protein n=1 Tax=Hymenobacter aquaticus TaxID=1867101 RepID=A0A4Z0PXS5_9BACT|nr:hypothetical protein [Hymenobacter aquaticus]TGE21242.1 hypothetical protein E5K00_13175 [Hymenobacter aquaticus]
MNRTAYWWAVGLLLGSYSVQAQPSLLGRDLEVSLRNGYLNLPPQGFYIKRIIEAQPPQRWLGVSRRGIFGSYRMMVVPQGVGPDLAALLGRVLPASPTAQPLVLRITGINASALASNGQLNSTAELAAEYYVQRPDSSYYLLARTYGNDRQLVTATPEQSSPLLLATLLQQSLEQVARADWTQPGPAYSLSQLRQPDATPYPIRTEALRMGIYRGFFEFRHNQPGRPGNVTVDARAYRNTEWQGKRAVNPSVLTPEGKHVAVTDAWGFCDGQQVYIQFQGEYYLLEQRGPNFMFFAPDFTRNSNGRVLNAGPPRKAFSLDMRSGLITDYQGTEGAAATLATRPTHLIVYRRRPGPALPVSVDDGPTGQLGADQYLSVPWQAAGQPVRLCVGSACLDVVPDPNAPTYVELLPEATARLVAVPAKQGEAQVTKLAGR